MRRRNHLNKYANVSQVNRTATTDSRIKSTQSQEKKIVSAVMSASAIIRSMAGKAAYKEDK